MPIWHFNVLFVCERQAQVLNTMNLVHTLVDLTEKAMNAVCELYTWPLSIKINKTDNKQKLFAKIGAEFSVLIQTNASSSFNCVFFSSNLVSH